MRLVRRTLAVAALAALSACASQAPKSGAAAIDDLSDIPRARAPGALADPVHDNLNAVLWSQTAAEYDALALQAFNQAARTLAAAKADPALNALVPSERSELPASAPLAIITDIDETVLDSSPLNADLIQNPIDQRIAPAEARKQFEDRWFKWVAQREALALPGAVDLLKHAQQSDVEIFYITNRKEPERAETCNNLVQARLPLKDCARQVLMRNDSDAKPKDKGPRRKIVGATHRVVLVLGDNLGDFADGVYGSLEQRDGIVAAQASWWGERWIMLPNPMYGSWEEVISNVEQDAASPTFEVEQQRRRLQKGRNLRGVDWWANPDVMPSKPN